MAKLSRYFYEARNGTGEVIAGSVEAYELDEALKTLEHQGITEFINPPARLKRSAPDGLTDAVATLTNEQNLNALIAEPPEPAKESRPVQSEAAELWSGSERAYYFRIFGTMLEAGVAAERAAHPSFSFAKSAPVYGILENVCVNIMSGMSHSEAFESSRLLYPKQLAMIKAGEQDGKIGLKYLSLADDEERAVEFRRRIVSRLMHSALIMVGIWGGMPVLLRQVGHVCGNLSELSPSISNNFAIRFMMLLGSPWSMATLWVMPGILLFCLWWLSKHRPVSTMNWLKRIYIFRSSVLAYEKARVIRSLSSLINAGVLWPTAFEMVADLGMRADCLAAAKIVREKELPEAFPVRPWGPLIVGMVNVGYESGKLPYVLLKAAEILESNAQSQLDFMLELLEPLLLAGVGLLVGAVCLMSFLPLLQMIASLG